MALAVPSLSMTSPLISTFQVLTTAGVAVLPWAERLKFKKFAVIRLKANYPVRGQ